VKSRIAPILTFTIALILVSSLAYAAKKKVAKPSDLTPDTLSEEEAFKTELLNATEDRENKLPGIGDTSSKKSVPATGYEKTNGKIIAKQPKKK
jgi:hypothetical protein